jgi:ketosteroid isomerase-like protein
MREAVRQQQRARHEVLERGSGGEYRSRRRQLAAAPQAAVAEPMTERNWRGCGGGELPYSSGPASPFLARQPSADSHSEARNDRYAILAAKTQFREAHNSADLDRLLDVFAAEFTDCSDGEPSFYGEEAARALRIRSEKLFRRFRVEMVVIVIDVVVKGGFAYDWGWHKLRLIEKDTGCIAERKYRYCETWKKERGKWKVDYIITNKELPPRMLAEEADSFTAAAAARGSAAV